MLRLRPFKNKDANDIVHWCKDEVSFRKWCADRYEQYPISPKDMISQYSENEDNDSFYPFTAFNENGIIGHFIMRFTDSEKKILRLGFIIVDHEKRGMGYGKEMVSLAVKYAFEILMADKVTLGVFENNSEAYHCYRAAGFEVAADEQSESYPVFGEEWCCIELEITEESYHKLQHEKISGEKILNDKMTGGNKGTSEKFDSNQKIVLQEFDSAKNAILNPWNIISPIQNIPKIAITCFARQTFDRLLSELGGTVIAHSSMANMDVPVYKVMYKDKEFALFMSDVGAASCVALLEDVYAMGIQTIVMFGTCGVLEQSIEDCSVIIPTSAIRDEGTSCHYEPASDEINVNVKYIDKFTDILDKMGCSYTLGKVWTTDGIYRETRKKTERRKEQGAICVDMECAAVTALAKFREKEVFQFFYAADNLDSDYWDKRSLSNSDKLIEKHRVAILAMEAAYEILLSS